MPFVVFALLEPLYSLNLSLLPLLVGLVLTSPLVLLRTKPTPSAFCKPS
jgi:hypothetical protein